MDRRILRPILLGVLLIGFNPNGNSATNLTQLSAASDVGDDENAPFAVSPDNQRVVYIANADSTTRRELYAVRFDRPGAPDKLSGTLTGTQEAAELVVSEDGQHVVFLVEAGGPGARTEQLFSTPIDGSSAPVALSPAYPEPANGVALIYQITRNSSHVVYTLRSEGAMGSVSQVFSVPIAGGPTETLSGPSDFITLKVADDGRNVVFFDGLPGAAPFSSSQLKSIPVAGGMAVSVSEMNEDVYLFDISPDGQSVVYAAVETLLTGGNTIKSKTISGDDLTTFVSATLATATVRVDAILITPDSQNVFYVERSLGSPLTGTLQGGGAIDGSGGVSVFAGNVLPLSRPLFTGDSEFLLYLSGNPTTGIDVVQDAIRGGGPFTLNLSLPAPSFFFLFPSFDGSRALYTRSDIVGGGIGDVLELYSHPLSGASAMIDQRVMLNDPLPSGGSIQIFFPLFDSSRVIYIADQNDVGVFELFEVPLAGGSIRRLNDNLAAGGDVLDAFPTVDGSKVVYRADQDTNGVFDLYFSEVSGPTSAFIFASGFEVAPPPVR